MDTPTPLRPQHGILLICLAAILWGTVGIATQLVYRHSDMNAFTIGFYRLACAFPVVALLCWKVVGSAVVQVRFRTYLKMALIGIMLALYQVFYFAAISHIGVTIATLITLCSAPVIVSLAAVVFLKEPLTASTLTALTCALSGTILLIGFPEDAAMQEHLLAGTLLALGSATGYAAVAMLGRSIAPSCHPIHSTMVSFGVGAIFLFPLAAANLLAVEYSGLSTGLLIYIGLVPTAVAYTLFFTGIRHVRASAAAILTMIEPLTAAILAWVLFGEQLAASGLAGAALLLAAIVVLYYRKGR